MAKARYIYRCLPAPRRVKRARGQRSPADALVAAMEAAIAEQAEAGWEYVRADLVPMESKAGLFGGWKESRQGVLVFRRPAAPDPGLDPEDEAETPRPVFAPGRRRPVEAEGARGGERDIPRLGAARID